MGRPGRGRAAGAMAALLAASLAACATPPASVAQAGVRLIGEQRIPHGQVFQGTVVGGLSGIGYDARSGRWIMVSDDRSEHGPARFYAARLDYDDIRFRALTLESVHVLRQPSGDRYRSPAQFPSQGGEVADIEAIRFDPLGDGVWYASEGHGTLGLPPFVRQAGADGVCRATLPLPAMFRLAPDRSSGPRNNLVFEGLTFAPDGRSLWLAMEAPLYQDGPVATPSHGAVSRLTQLDRSGKLLAQYAYPLDPVQGVPAPGRFADNGVSEILTVDARHLLVLERSGVQDADGRFNFHIRLYLAQLNGGTDVSGYPALAAAAYAPLRKRLLLNFDTLAVERVDNLEGMSWGPLLPNGHRSLVMVSDDDFGQGRSTQLLLFDVSLPLDR